MTNPFSRSFVSSDIVLRGVAIAWVVFNHAGALAKRPFELGGGLQVLLLLSGYSFARFTLTSETIGGLRRSIVRFATGLGLPSIAIVLVSFVVIGRIDLPDLFMIGNFVGISRLKLIYVWYPQVVIQMMAILLLTTVVPGLMSVLRRRPLAISVTALLLSLALFVGVRQTWDLGPIGRRMPHYVMWNFVLGWVVFFAIPLDGRKGMLARIAVVLTTAIVGYAIFGIDADGPRAIGLVIGCAVLISVRRIALPAIIARPLSIFSQAALTIFLTHLMFLKLFDALHLRQFKTGFHFADILRAWTFTMVGCVGLWLVVTALMRAWRYARMIGPGDTAPIGAVRPLRA